jgi:hypothetical protein
VHRPHTKISTRNLGVAAVAVLAGQGATLAAADPANALLPNRVEYFKGCLGPGSAGVGPRRVPYAISNYAGARSRCNHSPVPGWVETRTVRHSTFGTLHSAVGSDSVRSGPWYYHNNLAVSEWASLLSGINHRSHIVSGVSHRSL